MTGPPFLVRTQCDVLRLAVAGKLQREIGVLLGISESAVEQRLRSARRRLGARNTAQLVARAYEFSILELPANHREARPG